MAQITDMPTGLRPVQIFDVSEQVGWGLRNQLEDVQLVQFAINKVAPKIGLVDLRKVQFSAGPGMQVYAPLAPLVLDGKMGNETANAIRSYQNRSGATGARDNVVDPVHTLTGGGPSDPLGGQAIATFGKVMSRMMYTLNRDYVTGYGRIMNENEFPPQLRAQILRRLQPHHH